MASRTSSSLHPLQIPFDQAALFEPEAPSDETGAPSHETPDDAVAPERRGPLSLFRVQLLREESPFRVDCAPVETPEDAARIFSEYLEDRDREHFAVLLLDVRNRPIGLHLVSVGTLDAALVAPREVFKAALLCNAARILAAHNHPSGDPVPSEQDRQVTRQLALAGQILGIEVVDHLVIGERGRYLSLREQGGM